MAKKNIVIYSLFSIFLIVLAFSCGNGASSAAGEEGDKALSVSLAVSIDEKNAVQRVLTVNDDWGSYIFKYTATPVWSSTNNAAIQGTVAEMTEFSNGSPLPCKMLPGLWVFSVGVYDGDTLIYTGSSDTTYISSGNTSVQVAVSGNGTGGTSDVDIEIKVPVARASVSDPLTISWSGTSWGSADCTGRKLLQFRPSD